MKFKTTAKAIREGTPANYLRSAGYCDLYHLLINHNPIAYTCGVYGWNFDVYEVYDITICTGYRGMCGKRANNIGEYEARAKEILRNLDITYDERREEVEKLLKEFIAQC